MQYAWLCALQAGLVLFSLSRKLSQQQDHLEGGEKGSFLHSFCPDLGKEKPDSCQGKMIHMLACRCTYYKHSWPLTPCRDFLNSGTAHGFLEILFRILISNSCFVALPPPKRKAGDFSRGCYILKLRAKIV